ncbi:MAG: hypothetical protein F6K17_30830 [Okeania sp. SIO3C4]|nr:hypothetical protein [Okeania sp. SIO3C4]
MRIRNLIDEVHKKVAKWLTTEYRVMFIPTFESYQMVAKSGKKKRKLNSCVSSPRDLQLNKVPIISVEKGQ